MEVTAEEHSLFSIMLTSSEMALSSAAKDVAQDIRGTAASGRTELLRRPLRVVSQDSKATVGDNHDIG